MTIQQLHHGFMSRVNKIATSGNANFSAHEIDMYLTRAQVQFVDLFYPYKRTQQGEFGFEQEQYDWTALGNLSVVSPQKQPPVLPNEITDGIFEVNLDDMVFEPVFPTEMKVSIKKDKCTKKMLEIDLFKLDKRKTRLNQPSFEREKVHASFSRATDDTSLEKLQSVYVDSTNSSGIKQFDVVAVFLSYVKMPKPCWLGNYDLTKDLTGDTTDSTNVIYQVGVHQPTTLEVPAYFHDRVLDNAAMTAARDWNGFLAQQRTS